MNAEHASSFRIPAVITRVDGKGAMPGDTILVELVSVDVAHRQVAFRRVDG